jgi:hypothetical protein
MAHFAKLDENNIVIEVHVINNNDILDENGNESEQLGIQWLTNWSGGYTNWKQTSYNKNFRVHYAGVGFTYRQDLDAFVPPNSNIGWTLNEQTCLWEPPIPNPSNAERLYEWDDNTANWVLVAQADPNRPPGS